MIKDNYRNWTPLNDIPENLYYYGSEDTSDKLILYFKELGDSVKILKISFPGVLAYRISQESVRTKTLRENKLLRGLKVVTDSEYFRWFEDESSGIFDGWDLKHYFISNIDNVIDVICGSNVLAEWSNEVS